MKHLEFGFPHATPSWILFGNVKCHLIGFVGSAQAKWPTLKGGLRTGGPSRLHSQNCARYLQSMFTLLLLFEGVLVMLTYLSLMVYMEWDDVNVLTNWTCQYNEYKKIQEALFHNISSSYSYSSEQCQSKIKTCIYIPIL